MYRSTFHAQSVLRYVSPHRSGGALLNNRIRCKHLLNQSWSPPTPVGDPLSMTFLGYSNLPLQSSRSHSSQLAPRKLHRKASNLHQLHQNSRLKSRCQPHLVQHPIRGIWKNLIQCMQNYLHHQWIPFLHFRCCRKQISQNPESTILIRMGYFHVMRD